MHRLQDALTSLLGKPCLVTETRPVGGGCISDAFRVSVSVDQAAPCVRFVKRNDASFEDNFRCERLGLDELAQADAIRVPTPTAVGSLGGDAWLVAEWIESGKPSTSFFETFGVQLAKLHRNTLGTRIGWHQDNFLGAAKQSNTPAASWEEFVADRRIGHQLRWAIDQGLADSSLRRNVEAIIQRMPEILAGRNEQTSLLHGDLWSGNYLPDERGNPVIMDPAVSFGCREAEFGMIRLFGACPEAFYEAYQDAFPQADGWQRRVVVYVLYHLLNHLNLFGQGYLSQCHQTAAMILRH